MHEIDAALNAFANKNNALVQPINKNKSSELDNLVKIEDNEPAEVIVTDESINKMNAEVSSNNDSVDNEKENLSTETVSIDNTDNKISEFIDYIRTIDAVQNSNVENQELDESTTPESVASHYSRFNFDRTIGDLNIQSTSMVETPTSIYEITVLEPKTENAEISEREVQNVVESFLFSETKTLENETELINDPKWSTTLFILGEKLNDSLNQSSINVENSQNSSTTVDDSTYKNLNESSESATNLKLSPLPIDTVNDENISSKNKTFENEIVNLTVDDSQIEECYEIKIINTLEEIPESNEDTQNELDDAQQVEITKPIERQEFEEDELEYIKTREDWRDVPSIEIKEAVDSDDYHHFRRHSQTADALEYITGRDDWYRHEVQLKSSEEDEHKDKTRIMLLEGLDSDEYHHGRNVEELIEYAKKRHEEMKFLMDSHPRNSRERSPYKIVKLETSKDKFMEKYYWRTGDDQQGYKMYDLLEQKAQKKFETNVPSSSFSSTTSDEFGSSPPLKSTIKNPDISYPNTITDDPNILQPIAALGRRYSESLPEVHEEVLSEGDDDSVRTLTDEIEEDINEYERSGNILMLNEDDDDPGYGGERNYECGEMIEVAKFVPEHLRRSSEDDAIERTQRMDRINSIETRQKINEIYDDAVKGRPDTESLEMEYENILKDESIVDNPSNSSTEKSNDNDTTDNSPSTSAPKNRKKNRRSSRRGSNYDDLVKEAGMGPWFH